MLSKTSFYRLISLVTLGLVMACGIVMLLLVQSGPRVRSVTPVHNIQGLPTAKQQVIRFQFDRPIPPSDLKSFIAVSPATEFEIKPEGQTISVVFTKNLQYNADYTITIQGHLADERGRPLGRDYTYHFTSEPAQLVYVERNYDAPDRVISYNPVTKNSETIMTADTIVHLANNGSYLAIVQRNTDSVDEVVIREWASGAIFRLNGLKPRSSISRIELSAGNQLAAITPTIDKQASNELHRFSLSDKQATAVGQPIKDSMELKYSRDGQVIVIKKTDGLYYLGPTGADPNLSLLGEFFSIGGFNQNNDKLLVETNTSVKVYDAVSQQTHPLPELFGSNARIPTFLHLSDDLAYQNYRARSDTNEFETTVEVMHNKRLHTTLTLQPKEHFIGDIALSADDRYVAVQVATSTQLYDDYRLNTKPKGASIRLFDRSTQQYLPEKLTGVDPIWR